MRTQTQFGYHPLLAATLSLGAAIVSLWVATSDHVLLYVIVGALFLLCFAPACIDWYRGRLDFFETIHPFALIYFTYCGLGAIWVVNEPRLAKDIYLVEYLVPAAAVCLVGWVCLLGGYYGPWSPSRKVPKQPTESMSVVFVAVPGAVGALGYAASDALELLSLSGAPLRASLTFLSQLAPIFFFGWALAWLVFFGKKGPKGQNLLLFGLLVPVAVLIFYWTVGDKSVALSILGTPIVAFWYARRRVPWVTLAVLLLLAVFVVFPLYNTFRNFDIRLGFSKRVEMTSVAVNEWDMDAYKDRSVDLFKKRMARIMAVAAIVRDTGRWVPFQHGATIIEAPMMTFIPRFLWPDKPTANLGDDFAEIFRLRSPLDRHTKATPTIQGEFYWNFGILGVMIGMVVLGLIMRWLYHVFGDSRDPVFLAIHMGLLVKFAHLGSVSGGFAGITRFVLLVLGFRWLARRTGLMQTRANEAGSGGIPSGMASPGGISR